MAKITLDAKTFQALASATRLGVLRALDERRKTLTELARDLELNKATVHEHLQLLAAAGLVRKRDDEGRKWIYYELTWTGEKLLHPQETTTFNVLLGLGVAAAGGGVAMLGRALGWWLASAPLGADSAVGDMEYSPAQDHADGGTHTASSAPAGPGAGGAATNEEANRLAAELPPESPPEPAPAPDFFDDGGWLGLAMLGAAAVFTALSLALRRHIRPGRFKPPAGGEEPEGGPGGPSPP